MKNTNTLFTLICAFAIISCSPSGPQKISKGDPCDNCKMNIENLKYAAELITQKGRIYKFDDISCLNDFSAANHDKSEGAKTYVADYATGKLIEFQKASFIKGGSIQSPMGGNIQAYEDKAMAEKAKKEFGAQ